MTVKIEVFGEGDGSWEREDGSSNLTGLVPEVLEGQPVRFFEVEMNQIREYTHHFCSKRNP